MLRASAPASAAATSDALGLPSRAVEAVAGSAPAAATAPGMPGTSVPVATGAARPLSARQIVPGDNYERLQKRAARKR